MPTKIIGTEAYQVPRNSDLGSLAYQSAEGAHLGMLVVDGNVGVGNSNPAVKLDVNGTIRSFDGTVNNSLYTLSATGYVGTVSNHQLSLVTNNTARLTISAAGDTTVSNNLIVSGNLTVNGTTTTTNSTTVTIDDPIFTLGGDTAPASDDAKDRGIEFRWFNVSSKVGFFGFDRSTGRLTFIPDATNTLEVFSGTLGAIDVSGVFISGTALSAANLSNSTTGTAGTAVVLATSPTITTPTLSSPTLSGTTTLSTGKVRAWTSSDADIDGLISGTTSGLLFEGQEQGHFTVGIRGNDTGDGFQIVSKDAATTPATDPYKLLVFEAKADGRVQVGGGAIGSGLFNVNQNTIGNGTVSNAAGGTTVTGLNTTFTRTFNVGDTITIGGQTVAISAIASDTSMTTAAITAANSGVAYTLVGGQRLTVLGNGNVGVGGNTASNTRLYVQDTQSTVYTSTGSTATPLGATLHIQNVSNTNGAASVLTFGANQAAATSGNSYIANISSASSFSGTMVFGRRTALATYAESMRLDASGNLLLGTTTSRNRLTVQSPEATSPTLGTASGNTFLGNSTVAYGTMFGTTSSGWGWIQQQRVDGTATAYDLVLQPSGGNLGISTTDPTGGHTWSAANRVLGIAGGASESTASYGVIALTNNRATPSATDQFGALAFTSLNSVAGHKLKAYIQGIALGAGGVTGGYGGAIVIGTKPDNSATVATARMMVDPDGDLSVYEQMSLGGSHSPISGPILTLGTLVSGGTGYMNGTHTNVVLSGGTGPGALATVVVAAGVVSSVTLTWGGRTYKVGEVLTVPSLATTLATTVASGDGTTATITFAAQAAAPFQVGSQIIVAGVTPVGYNGTFTVTACTTTTVSYLNATTGAQTVAGTVKMGAALTSSTIPISTVNQVNLYVSSTVPRIRLENTNTTVTAGSELGTLYFSSRDASASGSGDTTYIRGVGVGTSGGGELQFFTSPNGGASSLAAVISGSNTFRLYNSAGTFYSDISSAANANRTVTLPDGNVTLSTGTMAITGGTLAQFAATTSAELAGVISDETGTGALVFATSPTLVTPALGTPASGNLANCTFPTLNQSTTGSAATLTTARTINGTSFNGSANITVTAAAGTLTGTTLNSTVVSSSLTSVGTLTSLGVGSANTTAGTILASGNITAFSDIRLKKDLVQIPNALNKVQQLTGYTYTRIDSGDKQTGLVAQDVQKILPEAVVEGEYLSVAYGNMVGLLVEAIKEQQQQYDAQQERITQLEAAVAKLLGSK